jgi:hypothetical protein
MESPSNPGQFNAEDAAGVVGGRERHRQPPLGDQEHLLQPGRAGLPKRAGQPAAATDDDVAAEDPDLDAVVGPEREVQGGLPLHHARG